MLTKRRIAVVTLVIIGLVVWVLPYKNVQNVDLDFSSYSALTDMFTPSTSNNKDAENQIEDSSDANALYNSQLNNAEQLKLLYLDESHSGSIPLGSTGNVPEVGEKTKKGKGTENGENVSTTDDDNNNNNNDSDNENNSNNDRSKPLSLDTFPDADSFDKITPGEFIKGDITFQNFFKHIFDLINNNHLSYPLARRMTLEKGKPIIDNVLFFADTKSRLSEWDLYQFFDFPQNFLDDLKVKHKNVVNGLPFIEPKFYEGNGYIMVGGGIYSWYALLGIETLRKVGATYPVEVILPDINDYEFEYCEEILPKLNARCVEMYRVFGKKTLQHFDVKGYQYKAFALLASSFENAFLLDSDAYPIKNPDPLFSSELFENYKMITWPDFWRRTGSPHFYNIQDKEIGTTPVRHLNDLFVDPKFVQYDKTESTLYALTYHDRKGTLPDWSTESGEMLINKKTHFRTLLLALYYNFDGPYGYYPLLSQGGAGEGDKETFVAAANFFDLPWYQVNKSPERAFGWYNSQDRYEHSSIVQYDPLLDYEILQKVQIEIRKDMEEQGESFGEVYDYDNYYPKFFGPETGQPMFYHVHDPKMNPFEIVSRKFTENLSGQKIRNMGEDFPRTDFDLELFLWEKIKSYICDEVKEFSGFDGKNWGALCSGFVQEEIEFLKKSGERIRREWRAERVVDQMRGKEWKD
ncbi:hypothetical protein DAMA08_014470 [Martiniozyma asiatica (nom. inval.)]|nr:hypothetical protein DAMA08_014470 [Martiniozyma asiatica]